MTRDLPHLALPRLDIAAERRRRPGGGRQQGRDDPSAHGTRLSGQLAAVSGALVAKRTARPLGINPRLVFRVDLQPGVSLDDTAFEAMGLHVLAVDGLSRIVVFPDDATLSRLRTETSLYASSEGARYKNLNAIEVFKPLEPGDRVGARLRNQPLADGELAPLDVELWHSGDRNEMLDVVDEIRHSFRERSRITDQYVGRSVCLLRMQIDRAVLDDLADLDWVKEVDRRPAPSFELLAVSGAALGDFVIGPPPRNDAPAIVVVDTGILAGHPLLDPVVAGHRSFVTEDDELASSGHGTWVSGIAAYGDVGESIRVGQFTPEVWLHSARVTITGDEYDPERLLESQLRELVAHYTGEYTGVRVFNISLGDANSPYVDGSLQFRLAAVIDELAYEYRDQEILFVISSGNQSTASGPEEQLSEYPTYLFEPDSRIIDPGTSCLALTVGGLSYGEGTAPLQLTMETTDRLIAQRLWPSPFTRSGLGHGGSLKPELVDFAGDVRFSRGMHVAAGGSGLPTTSHRFAPPEGELLRTVAGTSFAAPRVAHLAARLFDAFPGASSNLVRALIADSARIPDDRPPALQGLGASDERILRLYGYGQPSYERASASDSNDVLLVADDFMDIDFVRLYEVPALPREFRSSQGRGYISVALAYDPPTRHTRTKDYLGVRMQFGMYRNTTPQVVFEAIRAWNADERESLEGERLPTLGTQGNIGIGLEPGPQFRNRGTLQRGVESVANERWNYDGQPLVLAVLCQRRWARPEITSQRYAVVVSIRHDDPTVDLYATLRLRARAYERIRVRA